MIKLLDHVAIAVKDLEETIKFYDKIGFKPITRTETPERTIVFLEAGQARIELFATKKISITTELNEIDIGIKHIALMVDNIWKSYEEAKNRGIVFRSEPRLTSTGNIVTFFTDPNGVILQFLQRS